MSKSKDKVSWVEDLILLAIFFATVYITTYTLIHFGTHAEEYFALIYEFLRTPYGLAVMFFLGVLSGAVGIKEIYIGVYGRKHVALGFALIFIGSLFFIILFIAIVSMFSNFLEKLLSFLNW